MDKKHKKSNSEDSNDEKSSWAANQNSDRRLMLTSSEIDLHLGGIKTEKEFFCDICYVKHETADELDKCFQKHLQALKADSDVKSTDNGSGSVKLEEPEADDYDEEPDAAVEVKSEEVYSSEPVFASNEANLSVNASPSQLKRAYICDYCGVKKYIRRYMIEHLQFHLYGPFICNLCGKKLKTKSSLLDHMKTQHGASFQSHECPDCGKKFNQKKGLKRHVLKYHQLIITCPVCFEKFYHQKKLKAHMKNFHGNPGYKCKVCCETFPTSMKLYQHKHKYHTSLSKKTCVICSMVFVNPHGLKQHLEAKHQSLNPARNFPCAICNKQFKAKRNLHSHMQRHCEERRFICTHCSKKFKTKNDLSRHIKRNIKIHPKNPELQCQKCKKNFKNEKTLTVYMEKCLKKRLQCSKCPRTYSYQKTLNAHMKLHEKTYPCPKCSETFDLPETLRQHMNSVHSKTAVKCEICLQVLSSKRILAIHTQRIHTLNRPLLTCDLCGKKLKTKRSLLRHFSAIHKISFPRA